MSDLPTTSRSELCFQNGWGYDPNTDMELVLRDRCKELEARHSELVEKVREVGLLREEFKISSALRSGRNPNEIQKEFLVKLDELAKLAEVK